MRLKSVFWITALSISLPLLVACTDRKVNRTNFNYIDIGMHYTEVHHHLGEPSWCDIPERPNECRWGNDERYIHISFVGRRVINKESRGLN